MLSAGKFTWIILLFCMTAFPFLMGKGVLALLYDRKGGKTYVADCLLTGWIAVIGMAEAAHLAAVFLGRSFSDAVILFGAGVAVSAAIVGGILLGKWFAQRGKNRRKKNKYKAPYTAVQIVLVILFTVLVVFRMATIVAADSVYLAGDLTAETVESFLKTDAVYQVNPLTGRVYTGGVPLRVRILCLPTLYGALCKIFGISAAEMVWKVIPVTALLGSCLAYYLLSQSLFSGEKNVGEHFREKRWLFLVLVAILFLVGDYLYSMDGFGLAYSGFRGETLRNVILVPYTFSLVLRRRWKLAVLCVLAEACIVWTLYGMGVCLLVLAGMAVIRMFVPAAQSLQVTERHG